MPQYFGKLPGLDPSWVTVGAIASVQPQPNGLDLTSDNGFQGRIRVLAPNLVRIRWTPENFLPQRSWAVALADEQWDTPEFQIQETSEQITLQTQEIQVQCDRASGSITVYDSQGQPFAQDWQPSIGHHSGKLATWKHIAPDEHFYGFGERTGFLDKLSEIKTNWTVDALDYGALTDEMYQAIPFFMALRPGLAYGLFFNTTFWSQFDLGAAQPGVLQLTTRGPELDYYLIYGPTPAQILYTYTALTGRMPLPPKWSLGYHQCRWSYESETVVRNLAQEFRQRQIPCDVIHFDIDYMRGYRVFTWSPHRFPDPARLIQDLAQNGFKTVTIVDPGVKYEPEADYAVFDQGLQNNYFVRKADGALFHGYVWPDKAVFPDFLRPEVRQWWGDWQKSLTDMGVAGIWNDMNEPALDDRPFGDPGNKITFPLDAPQGPPDERSNHAETHNLYGLAMAQAAAEGLARSRPQERSFVLTRSGFAGVQRWSSVWMGDNQSLWEHLEMSLPMLCNMGLSGVGFVGCDIGGFAGNATAELFARWMQVGMLYPLMRGHSALSTAQHEPWVFGDRVEAICRDYINLRYQLLPYLYTLFWEAANTGAPILRPLLYEFPGDRHTYQLSDQVMLGSALMAAPILRPGMDHRSVYLPAGTWYDWWTNEPQDGPIHLLAPAPLEKMPLYVRAGSVIPLAPVMPFVDAQPLTKLTLKIWPGEGEWTLYEDDGHSFAYQIGQWATTTYRVSTRETPTVEILARQGTWTPHPRSLRVELVGIGEQQITDDGQFHRLQF